MKLQAKKNGKGYVTSYLIAVGCKEAREAGFLDIEGNARELRKTIDTKRKRIVIELEEEE